MSVAFDDHGEIVPSLGVTISSRPPAVMAGAPYVSNRSSVAVSDRSSARCSSTKCQNRADWTRAPGWTACTRALSFSRRNIGQGRAAGDLEDGHATLILPADAIRTPPGSGRLEHPVSIARPAASVEGNEYIERSSSYRPAGPPGPIRGAGGGHSGVSAGSGLRTAADAALRARAGGAGAGCGGHPERPLRRTGVRSTTLQVHVHARRTRRAPAAGRGPAGRARVRRLPGAAARPGHRGGARRQRSLQPDEPGDETVGGKAATSASGSAPGGTTSSTGSSGTTTHSG